nr:MAG TPA: hypothetical protein [Caudoviricetes sp.]
MASFLDKAGLTKFWENVKSYIDQNYLNRELFSQFFNAHIDTFFNLWFENIDYKGIIDTTFQYDENIKGYKSSTGNTMVSTIILLKYYNKKLLLKNNDNLRAEVKLKDMLNDILSGIANRMYLGRLPYHEIYHGEFDKIYHNMSFDIYLTTTYKGVISEQIPKLVLIPVPISNSYTFNFIPGEQMIRYLGGNTKPMSSYNYCRIDLVTNSPFDFTNTLGLGNNDKFDINRLVNLYNNYDIEYTIRYPRYLNGLLTFLKVNHTTNEIELADKTPNVVDGTYNEVVLTKDTGLYMYGDINISRFDFHISEEIKFDISSTQDTTNKLLSLKGDISTIYGLLDTKYISYNIDIDQLIDINTFKLFHSPYIGDINMSRLNKYIPFDPLNKYFLLYKGLFNNTGITTATAGIHIIGNNPYMVPDRGLKGIFNNYTEAYKNCSKLIRLNLYIYLEGDLNLDSTLEDYHIQNAINSIGEMVEGSENLDTIDISLVTKEGLNHEDYQKFLELMKPITDEFNRINPTLNISISNT